jgi:hypothetical protein
MKKAVKKVAAAEVAAFLLLLTMLSPRSFHRKVFLLAFLKIQFL